MTTWFEEYGKCGCLSPVVNAERKLPRYCPTHGNDWRALFKDDVQVQRNEPEVRTPLIQQRSNDG